METHGTQYKFIASSIAAACICPTTFLMGPDDNARNGYDYLNQIPHPWAKGKTVVGCSTTTLLMGRIRVERAMGIRAIDTAFTNPARSDPTTGLEAHVYIFPPPSE